MSKKIVLIDGHSILNRAFYGVPLLTNAAGVHTNAVYGFLNIMFKILEEEKPDYLVVAFDVHAKTFRHEIYGEYKGTRKGMPEELREQVPLMKEVLGAMNVVMMEKEGYEADDLLGTMAKNAEKEGMEVSLVSGDRDLLQIATDRIKIRIPKTKMGKTEIEDYHAEDVCREYQVTPTQFIEWKALVGDTADNIPGVPKIGAKTATELLVKYGTIDNIYDHVEEISKKSIKETLLANRELADLSKVLATIKVDCEISLDYEQAKATGYYTKEAYELFKRLEFKNMLSKFEKDMVSASTKAEESFRCVDKATMCKLLEKAEKLPVTGIMPVWENQARHARLLGLAISLSDEETCLYIASEEDEYENALSAMANPFSLMYALSEFSLKTVGIISTFDIKKQYVYLSQQSTEKYFDILIGAYLNNPLKSDYEIDSIGSEYLGLTLLSKAECFGRQSVTEALKNESDQAMNYFCYGAYVARKAYEPIENALNENGMGRLMTEIEMPLSLVLYDMEKEGIRVKRDELKDYGDALVERINQLEAGIHRLAGHEFNILSPKQLGEVLFGEMNLPGAKKTKTGYSTAAEVLEKLSNEYPIVADVLEYRGLMKLKSTYADGLANYIQEDGKIHSNFNQTITATGRISSTEPNLQNIPMRMELGRRIRKVFVPGEGKLFLDADYSQIELRVLAHMSGDEQLIEAYRENQDIHRMTASKVFHVPFEEVTDLQRRNAKAVNFGIVYGISSFGLSQDLSITTKEAAQYIEQYFESYPKIKEFLDKLVEDTKKTGYSYTMFGRRRPVPEIGSSNFMTRSFGERIAMNSPIQGTAADIIKIAMIRVWREIREKNLSSRLILQVHDELLIETCREEEEQVLKILVDNMTKAAELAVELLVDVHSGNDWFEAK